MDATTDPRKRQPRRHLKPLGIRLPNLPLNYREAAIMAAFWATPKTRDLVYGDQTCWFALQSAPGAEKRVTERLTDVGVRNYLPISTDWRKQSKREIHMLAEKKLIERSLFCGYLFFELPANNLDFGRVLVEGVHAILGEFSKPVQIRGAIVERIREMQDAGAFDATVKRGKVYTPKWARVGEKIRITDGSMAALEGLIREVLPNDKIRVDVEIFGRVTPVDLAIGHVAVAA